MAGRTLSGRRGKAKIVLGVSLLFAVGLFIYFWLSGFPFRAVGGGLLVIGGGVFEYRRTMQDIVAAERHEADAEASQRRRRG